MSEDERPRVAGTKQKPLLRPVSLVEDKGLRNCQNHGAQPRTAPHTLNTCAHNANMAQVKMTLAPINPSDVFSLMGVYPAMGT